MTLETNKAAKPLLDAAHGLLVIGATMAQQRTSASESLDELRLRLFHTMDTFERKAFDSGIAHNRVNDMKYIVCVFLDEMAFFAHPRWGQQRSNLQVHYFGSAFGGEAFFQQLDLMIKAPHSYYEELELFYICLAVGYEGRYRVEMDGAIKLRELRKTVYKLILPYNPSIGFALPTAAEKPHRKLPPLWSIGAVALVVMGLVYASIHLMLGRYATPVEARINKLFTATLQEKQDRPALENFLIEEQRQGLVQVRSVADKLEIHLMSDGLFDSGSADLASDRVALIKRIGNELAKYPGYINVIGHTDDRPIRQGFSSNEALSLERAKAVGNLLRGTISNNRISVKGAGASQPLVANNSARERALNRRVELDFVPDKNATALRRDISVVFDIR